MSPETKNIGLRGIAVADTKISLVDGDRGILYYRGYNIVDLAKKSTFEETAYLLLRGVLPEKKELDIFKKELAAERALPPAIIKAMQAWPKNSSTMDVLQSIVPMLSAHDNCSDTSKDCNYRRSIKLIAKTPTIVAHWDRIRKGRKVVPPDAKLGLAANFLYMLHGVKPKPGIAAELDRCLILHADHSFNASTFAAREVVSTRAHIYAGVSAAIGALSGELHGGANAKVMEMLLAVKEPGAAAAWVRNELESGRRIFGFGHAVYRTTDPRATLLKAMSREAGRLAGDTKWYDISQAVQKAAVKEFNKRKNADIYPNVDFYSASFYHSLGIDTTLFTPMFAISRMSGWCAHIVEEKFAEAQPKPMLYRPRSDYVGQFCDIDGCEYVPITRRNPASAKKKKKKK